jgi:alpha-tubulin suppressor-like RCC1 family protein
VPVPTKFDKIEAIQQIACGRYHTTFLAENGKIFECGGGAIELREIRIPDRKDVAVVQITSGGGGSMALLEDGRVFRYLWRKS